MTELTFKSEAAAGRRRRSCLARRMSWKQGVGFFVTELVTVVMVLELMQLGGLGTFAPFAAGVAGGLAALLGTAVFWRSTG